MARNSEKAQSMLFRFRAAQAQESGLLPTAGQRRPRATQSVTSIPQAEKWRGQILKEVSRKILKIQEESLSDFQIRDLNDELNKLMKEKWSWERRIRELGGPNYMGRGAGVGGVVFDDQGREVPGGGGGKGYRYFGRAKELPGVKEMFERAAKRRIKEVNGSKDEAGGDNNNSNRGIDRRNLDANYFGYGLDEEDPALLRYERRKEKEAVERLSMALSLSKSKSKSNTTLSTSTSTSQPNTNADPDPTDADADADADDSDPDWQPLPGDAGDGIPWHLPTLQQVQDELMARKRAKIMDTLE